MKKIRFLSIGALLLVSLAACANKGGASGGGSGGGGGGGGGGGSATTVEVVSEFGTTEVTVESPISKTVGGLTIAWTGAYRVFPENNEVRVYAGKTLTVSGNGISSIQFVCANKTAEKEDDKGGPDQLSTTTGTYTYEAGTKNGSWSGSASSIVFTAAKQCKIVSMTVTYLA